MPELPEVETVRRVLEPQVKGRKITGITIAQPKIIAHPGADAFAAAVAGSTIVSMGRRGKYLAVVLDDGGKIVLHLRMTGHLLVTPDDFPEQKHTYLVLQLEGDEQVRYIDPRRFGRFWYVGPDEDDVFTGMDKLGPEPLDDSLTGEYLKRKLGKRTKAIKEMLHDQTIVAGIGNIYSDEILFAARIRPDTRCSALSTRTWNRLAEEIRNTIGWGIAVNEMTAEEYLEGKGEVFHNMPLIKVYGHEGAPCPRCGHAIKRVEIGGRGSYYCPACQRKRS